MEKDVSIDLLNYKTTKSLGKYLATAIPLIFQIHPLWNIDGVIQWSNYKSGLRLNRREYNRIIQRMQRLGLLSYFNIRYNKLDRDRFIPSETELVHGYCIYSDLKEFSFQLPSPFNRIKELTTEYEVIHFGKLFSEITQGTMEIMQILASKKEGWWTLRELGNSSAGYLKIYTNKIDKLEEEYNTDDEVENGGLNPHVIGNENIPFERILETKYDGQTLRLRLKYTKFIYSPSNITGDVKISESFPEILRPSFGLPNKSILEKIGIGYRYV